MKLQKQYNNKIVPDIDSEETKDRITQNLALCTHAEISALVNAVNFKHHHGLAQKLTKIIFFLSLLTSLDTSWQL